VLEQNFHCEEHQRGKTTNKERAEEDVGKDPFPALGNGPAQNQSSTVVTSTGNIHTCGILTVLHTFAEGRPQHSAKGSPCELHDTPHPDEQTKEDECPGATSIGRNCGFADHPDNEAPNGLHHRRRVIGKDSADRCNEHDTRKD
jgi:hypothetical protein